MPLEALKSFDVGGADITVWAVKKSGGSGEAAPIFTARWVETDQGLDSALKAAIETARGNITELKVYNLLAQNNESSALSISSDETYAALAIAACADPTPNKKVKNLKEISNSAFYVVKLVKGDDVIYAFRKTDGSWRSKTSAGLVTAVFVDNILSLDDRPRFTLSNHLDFFVVGEDILVMDKGSFESILNYKQTHVDDFATLQQDPVFADVFTSMDELVAFVGSNKIQLRRASAIKSKGHYKDHDFMNRLRSEAPTLKLKIAFDAAGRIAPTADSCRDIFQALLDFRLDSRLSRQIYDVDNTASV